MKALMGSTLWKWKFLRHDLLSLFKSPAQIRLSRVPKRKPSLCLLSSWVCDCVSRPLCLTLPHFWGNINGLGSTDSHGALQLEGAQQMFIEQVCNNQSQALQTSIRAPDTALYLAKMRALQLGDALACFWNSPMWKQPLPQVREFYTTNMVETSRTLGWPSLGPLSLRQQKQTS